MSNGDTGWWVADLLADSPALLVAWAFWVICSIVLHELAHGWAAIRLGDRTPIEMGRMTWNPLVHMGTWSLVAFALIGIAWGQMPVNTSRMRGRYADTIVSAAGPAMNLALALMCVVLGAAWAAFGADDGVLFIDGQIAVDDHVLLFFFAGAGLNILLALFNLMPVPPLDGSHILADHVPAYRNLIYGPRQMTVMLVGMLVMFWFAIDLFAGFGWGAAAQGIELGAQLHGRR